MDRYWHLTWRTYGTRLPGDPRGFVSEFRDHYGRKVTANTPGEPPAADMPSLARYSASAMTAEAVILTSAQAIAVLEQARETAAHRRWQLLVVSVMPDHVHLVVGVPGDPDPERLLADFKAWATRRLSGEWGRRRWWVQSGSRRKKADPTAIRVAVEYVRDQPGKLAGWIDPRVANRLAELDAARGATDQASGGTPRASGTT